VSVPRARRALAGAREAVLPDSVKKVLTIAEPVAGEADLHSSRAAQGAGPDQGNVWAAKKNAPPQRGKIGVLPTGGGRQ
jgi:hypothetical protein